MMLAAVDMVGGGVCARFPGLTVAFLEGNCSWAPWLLWRLDEHWEMSAAYDHPDLTRAPSEYFRRQCYLSVDCDEEPAEIGHPVWTGRPDRVLHRLPPRRLQIPQGGGPVLAHAPGRSDQTQVPVGQLRQALRAGRVGGHAATCVPQQRPRPGDGARAAQPCPPRKAPLAFLDTAETRTYTMLHQVLHNQTTLYTLSFPHTLGTCGALFALLCAQLDAPDDDLETEVTQLLATLKQETRARQTLPPLYTFPAAFPTPEALGHLATSEAVFAALAQRCHDSLEAERITHAGAVRIVLSLLADLFAMLRHQYAHTATEVETQIDRLRGPLRAQITAYRRRQAPG